MSAGRFEPHSGDSAAPAKGGSRRAGDGMRRRWVAAVIGQVMLPGWGCMRQADIIDEPDVFVPVTPIFEAGPTPIVDSGLGTDAFSSCAERPLGACRGPIDFPCSFQSWVTLSANKCLKLTNCSTNGWLRVHLGADGCVNAIGMDQPNEAAIRCLATEFGPYRCPCGASEVTHFFGLANTPDSGTCTGPKGLWLDDDAVRDSPSNRNNETALTVVGTAP